MSGCSAPHALIYFRSMSRRPKLAIFPGTFDPITNGHLDVIRRGQSLFDELIVAIGQNPEKQTIFDVHERLDMIRTLVDECCTNTRVEAFTGLTVDYARAVGATVILRGLRNVSDLHYEFQLALTNRAIADIETVFIMTGEAYAFTSSSLIKQIAAGGNVDRLHRLLPPLVLERMKTKFEQMGDQVHKLREDGLQE